jgi:hypothetical protein
LCIGAVPDPGLRAANEEKKMKKNRMSHIAPIAFVVCLGTAATAQPGPLPVGEGEAAVPAARKIPGITTTDAFPRGCVDCHVKRPDKDVRISTLMKQWNEKVDARLLDQARAATSEGATLKGKHPPVGKALEDIPAACLKCHNNMPKGAPALAKMLHRAHLSTNPDNHFMTLFQGECTHCHKLKLETGEWSMPSGPER